MTSKRLATIIRKVLKEIPIDLSRFENRDPYETLVAVILSQKTNRQNVKEALKRFREKFRSIKEVAEASVDSIAEAIKPAGLWRMKAPRIKLIAEQLVNSGGGLEKILSLPYPEAKKVLSSMKGIGPKTADVYLMIIRRDPVFPVDTHIFRIMKRLGVADEKDDYESLRKKLERATPPEKRMKAHLALIEFGRTTCRARNPRCDECFLSKLCPSSGKFKKSSRIRN
ncbi:MAG: endonuclease III [Thaumarchaeota archaeon]|nr:endonuclease III [Nitrososphaerota archaeon]